jgi:hypothetical protein
VTLDRAANMKSALGSQIDLVRFFGSIKHAKVHPFAINGDVRLKTCSMFSGTKQPTSVSGLGSFEILKIYLLWDIAQVVKSIVKRVPINMVYRMCRPYAIHEEPCQPVFLEHYVVDSYLSSADRITSGSASNDGVPSSPDDPHKHASLRIVVQDLAQAFYGKILLSHDAPPVRWDQRPVSVAIAAWASPFYMAVA